MQTCRINNVGLNYLNMCNLFRQIVSAGHGVSKNSCIDYACLVHFVTGIRFAPHLKKSHLVVFFAMQLVGYNIVTTSLITVFHILCLKDLSNRLLSLNIDAFQRHPQKFIHSNVLDV